MKPHFCIQNGCWGWSYKGNAEKLICSEQGLLIGRYIILMSRVWGQQK